MDRAWFHEVNLIFEQAFEILCEAQIVFRMIGRLHLPEFDEQIEIAPVGSNRSPVAELKLRGAGPCGACRYG